MHDSRTNCFLSGGITRFSNTTRSTAIADVTHRRHAIIETVFADLIGGPLAHNLLRATGALAGDRHSRAREATLQRKIVNIPARLYRPPRKPILRLPNRRRWPDTIYRGKTGVDQRSRNGWKRLLLASSIRIDLYRLVDGFKLA